MIDVIEAIKQVNENNDEKSYDAWNNLNLCQPFSLYEERISNLENEIQELKQIINTLRKHKHTDKGDACILL